jgi:hypothetical protein
MRIQGVKISDSGERLTIRTLERRICDPWRRELCLAAGRHDRCRNDLHLLPVMLKGWAQTKSEGPAITGFPALRHGSHTTIQGADR